MWTQSYWCCLGRSQLLTWFGKPAALGWILVMLREAAVAVMAAGKRATSLSKPVLD